MVGTAGHGGLSTRSAFAGFLSSENFSWTGAHLVDPERHVAGALIVGTIDRGGSGCPDNNAC